MDETQSKDSRHVRALKQRETGRPGAQDVVTMARERIRNSRRIITQSRELLKQARVALNTSKDLRVVLQRTREKT